MNNNPVLDYDNNVWGYDIISFHKEYLQTNIKVINWVSWKLRWNRVSTH